MARSIVRIARSGAIAGVVSAVVAVIGVAPAVAVDRPVYDPTQVPPDGAPAPPEPMHQSSTCLDLVALPQPDVFKPAPAFEMLNIDKAWAFSTR